MIQVTNNAAQTLQPGQAISFNSSTFLHAGCGECFNPQLPTSVKLMGGCRSIYVIEFSGNVTSATAGASVQLALAVEGQPFIDTAMNATIGTANALYNVNTGKFYRVECCDADRISVINTGTVPVTVAPNASLRIMRRA